MHESLIPQRYKVLSNSALKVLATISMFVDHIAINFFAKDTTALFVLFGKVYTRYVVMRLFGRIAFPIFAFLLVEGFVHTHDRKAYGVRLFVFSLVSELAWDLLHGSKLFVPSSQSVFVTLFVGFVALNVAERIVSNPPRDEALVSVLCLVGLFLVAAFARADYGTRGLGLILALYLLREQPALQAIVGSCMLINPVAASCAFIPINLYNGRRGFVRGRALQLLFYAIYPLHMLLLYYLKTRVLVP